MCILFKIRTENDEKSKNVSALNKHIYIYTYIYIVTYKNQFLIIGP